MCVCMSTSAKIPESSAGLITQSTMGKELYCQVRLRVEKPSGSLGFVVMVLLFDGRELLFGSSLADQGILWDSERSDCLCSHPDEADIM